VVEIPLTRGLVAQVSEVDAAWVQQHNWQAQRANRTWYAKTLIDGRTVKLHRAIAERAGLTIDGMQVDHVNGDGLDDRRENLRVATGRENMRHQTRKARGCSSQHKGVSWNGKAGRWYACIVVDGRHVNLGLHDSETDAAAVYDAAAREHFGDFAAVGVVVANDVEPVGAAGPSTPRKCRATSSRYLRTSRHRLTGKWSAQVKGRDGKLVHVPGLSESAEEMALFADILARHVHGDGARLNFPELVATLPPLLQISPEQIGAAASAVKRSA
jgi:hypothetical protein